MQRYVFLFMVNIAVILGLIGLILTLRRFGLEQSYEAIPHEALDKARIYAKWEGNRSPERISTGMKVDLCYGAAFIGVDRTEQPSQAPVNWTICSEKGLPGELLLSSFLEAKAATFYFFDIRATDAKGIPSLVELLRRSEVGSKSLFTSSYQVNLTEMRKAEPRWAFGLPQPLLAKVFLLEALYLETFVSIPFDFIFVPAERLEKRHSHRWLQEMLRRKLPLIVDVGDRLPAEIQFPEEANKNMKGVVTTRPTEWSFQLP